MRSADYFFDAHTLEKCTKELEIALEKCSFFMKNHWKSVIFASFLVSGQGRKEEGDFLEGVAGEAAVGTAEDD